MTLDLGSFAFNAIIESGGNTPSWGTALGQGEGHKITCEDGADIILGMTRQFYPKENVYCPLGKGGKVYSGKDSEEIQQVALFKKVYVNETRIDYPFILLIQIEQSEYHAGRLNLKYSPKICIKENDATIYENAEFINKVYETLNISRDACWFVYELYVEGQDTLRLSAVFVDENQAKTYNSAETRKREWTQLIPKKIRVHHIDSTVKNAAKFSPFIAAIKTKPFLLLAGISGTGKSRIVRELARACWPEGDVNKTAQMPENFAIIPVRPNWHDSTGLIGYVSNIPNSHYVAGPFLKAVIKAWEMTKDFSEYEETTPFFVCLDEMNLAPVEQYFAEYLSCIESRNDIEGKGIITDVILKEATQWYHELCTELTENQLLREHILANGISLPPNLIVCGTVNMDETTYAFSRKVLDRAMTIEMNEVDLHAGFDQPEETLPNLNSEMLLSDCIKPEKYYGKEECKETINEVLGWLEKINTYLDDTPFKIAYRSRNEIMLYVIHSEELGKDRLTAFDEAVNMKILPRIEGDQKKVGDVLKNLRKTIAGITNDDEENPETSISLRKLKEMEERTNKQYYCTYWT